MCVENDEVINGGFLHSPDSTQSGVHIWQSLMLQVVLHVQCQIAG